MKHSDTSPLASIQFFMTKQRALVTGGADFCFGSHLCDALLGDGYSVLAVDNLLQEENQILPT